MQLSKRFYPTILLLAAALSLMGLTTARAEGLTASAGPYRVEVTTDPSPIPIGPAKIRAHLTDAAGKDVAGAHVHVLAQMPGMPMGESLEEAQPLPGKPGHYEAPANFQMAGGWDITVEVEGPQGSGKTVLGVRTGQSTTGPPVPGRILSGLLFFLVLAAVALILYRMWRAGARLDLRSQARGTVIRLRSLANPRAILGLLMLAAIYWGGQYAIAHYRRPGAMSVIEAQAMDMTVMKPPVGAVPVAVAKVKRGSLDATVRYTGSVVPYVEQDVYPRVTGWIRWMPLYPGDRVKRGQLLARLDTAELNSRVNERSAARTMAEHQHMVARQEERRARAQIAAARGAVADMQQQRRRAQAAVRQTASELIQARQDEKAAQEERVQAEAELAAAESGQADAEAAFTAAQADQEYWRAELKREAELLKTGAVSQEEYQREKAQAETADAKVRQAQAKLRETQATIRSAQAKIRKAEAMIAGATAKVSAAEARVEQAESDVAGAAARVTQARGELQASRAAAESAFHQVEHTQAGIRESQAMLNTARVVKEYTEIRSEVDGVVTQRMISPGVLVNPGMAILKIAQIRPIRLQANVAEEDLAGIRVGSAVRARVSKGPERVIPAKVTAVFPAADPVARTGIVEAVVPNQNARLLPGEYVVMEITTGRSEDGLLVPSSAVVRLAQASNDVLSLNQAPAIWTVVSGKEEKPVYICTMHPKESKSDKPGKCPI